MARSYVILPGVVIAMLSFTSGAAAASFSASMNPAASYVAASAGGHGADLSAERFLESTDNKWSLTLEAGYSWLTMGRLNSLVRLAGASSTNAATETAAQPTLTFDSSKERRLGATAARYHGPNQRLFATMGLTVADAENYVHKGGEHLHERRRTLLPEGGYGCRWTFRHGGFISMAGALAYRIPLMHHDDGEISPDHASTNKLADQIANLRVVPGMRLGIGYVFR